MHPLILCRLQHLRDLAHVLQNTLILGDSLLYPPNLAPIKPRQIALTAGRINVLDLLDHKTHATCHREINVNLLWEDDRRMALRKMRAS